MWMRLVLIFVLLAGLWGTSEVHGSRECNAVRLNQLLNGLLRSLQYMDAHKTELNLDGMIGVRMTGDQMKVLAENVSQKNFTGKRDLMLRLEYLANMSNYIVERGDPFVYADDPHYYKILNGIFDSGAWKLRYPQRNINRKLQRAPLPCKDVDWLERDSDKCISEITSHSSNQPIKCNISKDCLDYMTRDGYKDYSLTHELLYLQIVEMHGCIPTLIEMGYNLSYIVGLQDAFCANVLRDTEEIARNDYPLSHMDLFLEQIGICGMYGFNDFWNEEWVDKMLEWQNNNGCYIHSIRWSCQDEIRSSKITKRNDKRLDGGCSSHMTAVALIAMSVSVRFCAEAFAGQS